MFTLVTLIYIWSIAGAYAYSLRAWFTGDLPPTLHFAIVKVKKETRIQKVVNFKLEKHFTTIIFTILNFTSILQCQKFTYLS